MDKTSKTTNEHTWERRRYEVAKQRFCDIMQNQDSIRYACQQKGSVFAYVAWESELLINELRKEQ